MGRRVQLFPRLILRTNAFACDCRENICRYRIINPLVCVFAWDKNLVRKTRFNIEYRGIIDDRKSTTKESQGAAENVKNVESNVTHTICVFGY